MVVFFYSGYLAYAGRPWESLLKLHWVSFLPRTMWSLGNSCTLVLQGWKHSLLPEQSFFSLLFHYRPKLWGTHSNFPSPLEACFTWGRRWNSMALQKLHSILITLQPSLLVENRGERLLRLPALVSQPFSISWLAGLALWFRTQGNLVTFILFSAFGTSAKIETERVPFYQLVWYKSIVNINNHLVAHFGRLAASWLNKYPSALLWHVSVETSISMLMSFTTPLPHIYLFYLLVPSDFYFHVTSINPGSWHH